MRATSERSIGGGLALLGAVLVGLEGLLVWVGGVVATAAGRPGLGTSDFGRGLVLVVVAVLAAFFASLGRRDRAEYGTTAGAVLVVLAVTGFFVLGFQNGVLALLGGVLFLVGGVVLLFAGR